MKDAAGHDRMYVGSGWISVTDDSLTISDGDGYTLPQTIFFENDQQRQNVIDYVGTGANPTPMGPEKMKEDGWTYISPNGIDGLGEGYDFRYKPIGPYRVQSEVNIDFRDKSECWENFGVFKSREDLYGEIELSRAEPDPS